MAHPLSFPANEQARIEQLEDLMVLDTPPDQILDEITKLASMICGTPIALISLIDKDRQWFKANVGLKKVKQTKRNVAFCSHAILEYELMEVNDATLDERFSSNPLVTGEPKIRFYAGAQLTLSSGANIGTLCVINNQPQVLSIYQKAMLEGLATLVVKTLVDRQEKLKESLQLSTNP